MKNHTPILSFVLPVYNVATYLRKCVDSLLAQDYNNYEIILVDDGSTDESGTICEELASCALTNSPNTHSLIPIRVIHQENKGLSAARNAGLKMAKGKYVCFVDSDDYWEPNVLGKLMAQMEREELDVLRFDYQNVNAQYEVFEPNKEARRVDRCKDVMDGETYLNTRMGYACYAVMYVMRRRIVPEFTEGIHFEDVDWLPRMLLRAKKVNSTTTVVYNYLVRQGSITKVQGDIEKQRKNTEDQLDIIRNYTELIMQNPTCKWLRHMQSGMAVGILTSVALHFYKERKEYIRRLKAQKVFPLAIADQGKTYVRRARLINAFGPHIYCAVMHMKQ